MEVQNITELSDFQMESISGGNYYTWRTHNLGSSGSGCAPVEPAGPTSSGIQNNNFYGPTYINYNVINIINSRIDGILAIDVNQGI